MSQKLAMDARPSPARLVLAVPSPATTPQTSPPLPAVVRPPMTRSHSHSHSASVPSKASSTVKSLPPSAHSPFFLTPQPSSVNVSGPRRLLMPTVRHIRHPASSSMPSPRPASQKSPQSRLSRSRASSVVPPPQGSPDTAALPTCVDWIGAGCKFEVVAENIVLDGYQLYAVEKWVVERRRPVTVLVVYTGDSRHRITVNALSPVSSLSATEAHAEWEKALLHLRREGARPKDTERGVVMVTSLANFRSDFTIVHIPRGNFLDVREQLYTNINVLRMGCSGRSALTLEEPSDTTKDRFISMYHLSDKVLSRSQAVFNPTVIELIKLIQASLAICGMFPLAMEERNGLLCDVTLEGIQRWVTEMGEPLLNMEPLERTLDPAMVAALFSTILTTRNKLQALGHPVPKDPLIDPTSFLKSLHSFSSSIKPNSHGHSLSLSYHSAHSTPIPPSTTSLLSSFTSPAPGAVSTHPNTSPVEPSVAYLTFALITAIQAAYDKLKQSESYKVHRVLINKLDDLATDLRTTSESKLKSLGGGGWWGQGSSSNAFNNNNQPLADLSEFVRCVSAGGGGGGGSGGGASSLRYLWTGRPEEVGRKRREKEVAEDGEWGDGDVNAKGDKEKGENIKDIRDKDKEKDRDKDKDKERDSSGRMSYDREVKSSEDEGELGFANRPWSGRVQRKIEVWAALGRSKKLSSDFGAKGRAMMLSDSPPRTTLSAAQSTSQLLPSVVISKDPADEDDVLSSGQTSPVLDGPNPLMLGLGGYPHAQRSATELREYDRRINEFETRRPSTKAQYQTRIISWSDPVTARGLLDEDGDSLTSGRRRAPGASPLGRDTPGDEDLQSGTGTLVGDEYMDEGWGDTHIHAYHRQRTILLKKRRSFDDADRLRHSLRILPPERMRVDVELCGQLLILRRREAHLANVISCLRALTHNLSLTNAGLRNDYDVKQSALASVDEKTSILQDVEGLRIKADAMSQETQALAYESAQFMVDELWHMASQPRQKVVELREKVFGTGTRRMRAGGARGRFCRVQVMLDGSEVLVDELGRTESEAEEEERFRAAGGEVHIAEADGSRMSIDNEDEVEGMELPSLRPTWVLRLFNYWGGRWGARARGPAKSAFAADGDDVQDEPVQQNGHRHGEAGSSSQEETHHSETERSILRNKLGEVLSTSVDAFKDVAPRRATTRQPIVNDVEHTPT